MTIGEPVAGIMPRPGLCRVGLSGRVLSLVTGLDVIGDSG